MDRQVEMPIYDLLRSSLYIHAPPSNVFDNHAVDIAHTIFIIINIIYVPLIFGSNGVVFWSIVLNPEYGTAQNYLVCSLAVVNVLMGALTIPLYVLATLENTRNVILDHKYACLLMFASAMLAGWGSLLHMLIIAVDRYVAVLFPVVYTKICTKRNARRVLSGLWIYILFISFLPLVGFNTYDPLITEPTDRCTLFRTQSKYYIWWAVFGTAFVCMSVPLIIYVQLVCYLCNKTRLFLRPSEHHSAKEIAVFKKRTTSVKISSALMFVFILLWTPYLLLVPLKYTVSISQAHFEILRCFALLCGFANSAISSPIYARGNMDHQVYKLIITTWPWKLKKRMHLYRREKLRAAMVRRKTMVMYRDSGNYSRDFRRSRKSTVFYPSGTRRISPSTRHGKHHRSHLSSRYSTRSSSVSGKSNIARRSTPVRHIPLKQDESEIEMFDSAV